MEDIIKSDVFGIIVTNLDFISVLRLQRCSRVTKRQCDKSMNNEYWKRIVYELRSEVDEDRMNDGLNYKGILMDMYKFKRDNEELFEPDYHTNPALEYAIVSELIYFVEFQLEYLKYTKKLKGEYVYAAIKTHNYNMIKLVVRYIRPIWSYLENYRIECDIFIMLFERAEDITEQEIGWLIHEFSSGRNWEVVEYLNRQK